MKTSKGATMFRLKRRLQKRKGFVFVGYLTAFRVKPFLVIHLMGKPVAVFKRSDGTLFAWEMACTHQGADLTKGILEGGVVTCPRHGRRFDLETGECLNRNSPPLRKHAVRLKGYGVYVSLAPKSSKDETGRPKGCKDASGRKLSDLV